MTGPARGLAALLVLALALLVGAGWSSPVAVLEVLLVGSGRGVAAVLLALVLLLVVGR